MQSTPKKPLSGIRVVEVGLWHAGPGAGAILGDLGAEVIKVETLEGDPERFQGHVGPLAGLTPGDHDDWNLLFEFSNRNKKGIAVDIGTPDGRTILNKLVARADIFISNLRPASKQKLAIDFASLKLINPLIVHVNVTAYGSEGPSAHLGGFEPVGQAMSGMMGMAGTDTPQLLSVLILDQLTAITASHAAVTGLAARELHGEAQEVETSLLGSAIWLTGMNLFATSVANASLNLKWDRVTSASPLRTTFQCKDGLWVMGSHHAPKYWGLFCTAIGREDLNDERFDTQEKRAPRNAELIATIGEVMLAKDRAEWLKIFSEHKLLFGPVNSLLDTVHLPQALENNYMVDIQHRYLGNVTVPGFPIKFGSATTGPHLPAPQLGEHTREVLSDLDYSEVDIASLIAVGTVRASEL